MTDAVRLAPLLVVMLALLDGGPCAPPRRFATTFDVSRFLKGNLHTHTNRSDGNDAPEDVVAWYRSHGYQFVALTDHNLRSDPSRYGRDDGFTVLSGEEISMTGAGRQVHVNGLCTRETIGGGAFAAATDALAWATAQVAAQGGVALVNHPNFDRGLTADDLLAARRASLLEIASGHPYVFSDGVGERPSHEALWDWSLGHDLRFAGVAVDDTHRLEGAGDPPAYPGRGWVEVFADRVDARVICEALRRGRLYASTGVRLSRIRVTPSTYDVWADEDATVAFIGCGGAILERREVRRGERASYEARGDEGCVRARVERDERRAWTPAVFLLP
jgi:hypothetical protein